MCKSVTVNCLFQYSGCKCISAFIRKTIAFSHTFFLMWVNKECSDDRHITYGTSMISWMCLSPLISYFYYNSEISGWCKTEESVCFGVCCIQMSTVNICEKVPQQCTAWIWCIMCPVHCELILEGAGGSAYKFWLLLWFWLIWNFLVLTCSCCSILGWYLLKLSMHFNKAIV